MVITSPHVLLGRSLLPASILIEEGMITGIGDIGDFGRSDLECSDMLLPGFIDIHTHGGDMIDVNNLTCKEEVDRLSLFYASHGVTSFLSSVLTDTREQTEKVLGILTEAICKGTSGAELAGIHLEGPFLSPEYKGAMPAELILDGDIMLFRHYQELAEGNIRYITLAPECNGCMSLISYLHSNEPGCAIAMGHSSADYETAVEAVEKGVRASTHLFNAMKLFHMHRPAISGASLERDEVTCEIISDGFHLHPATVRLIIKTKGLDKVVAITDSIMAAGLPDGNYRLGVNDVIVKDGDAKLSDGVRAGSTLTMDRALRKLAEFTSLRVEELAPLVSGNAARLLSLSDRGIIAQGRRADLVLLDDRFEVQRTFVRGREVYNKEKG